jgi:uncharacterized protein involved in exopolysaccharide biosynthesis
VTATTSGTEAPRTHPRPSIPEGATPLGELLGPVRRRWRLVAACSLAAGMLAAVISLLLPPVYTARTTFTPVASSQGASGGLASLVGLAGQLGLSSLTGGSIPPEYFAEVLRSRSILEATLRSKFPTGDSAAAERPLLDILKVNAPSPGARMEQGALALDGLVLASVDKRTGIIDLRVKSNSPVVAASVANRMVQLLNEFNLDRRQVQSREQRRFTGERTQQAQEELRVAEAALLRFLQSNREYVSSPVLEYQYNRLQREVQVKQEVYLTLTKAYEEARVAEVRDIPVLTIIDPAVPPVLRSSPRRKLNTLLGLFLGGVIGIAAAYLYQAGRDRRARGDLRHAG